MASLFLIAEKVKNIIGKGDIQSIISSVVDVYASQVSKSWYEGKQDGISEIQGVYIYTFKNITPELDCGMDLYFITIPSSYLSLPNEMGINTVSFMKGQTKPFVRVGSASWGLFANLKAGALGGNNFYFVENDVLVENSRMYFPKFDTVLVNQMIADSTGILLKLAIALDTTDVEAELNIPPNKVDEIVNAVILKFQPKVDPVPNNLN